MCAVQRWRVDGMQATIKYALISVDDLTLDDSVQEATVPGVDYVPSCDVFTL